MFFTKKNKKLQITDRPGLITVNNPMSVVSEQFRTIRTNIQFSMVDKDLKTIYRWVYGGLWHVPLSVLRQKGKRQKRKETRGRFNIGTSIAGRPKGK